MKLCLKIPIALTALLAMLSADAGAAWADGRHHHRKHGHSHQHKHLHHKPAYSHRRYDSDDDEELLIGLLLGGLFGYAIGNASQANGPDPATYYPPAAAYHPVPAYQRGDVSATTCLQEREYQMKVIVGGKEADAYGTACLQPDGSWHRGPARLVSH